MEAMSKNDKLCTITIVGRPNVGKSSIFNRILRERIAVVHREPGTTRDTITEKAGYNGKRFRLVDTGGFPLKDGNELLAMVKVQIGRAIKESDMLLFICDGQVGISPQDLELASFLRKSDKKFYLVINKVDNERIKNGVLDFYQLGLGKPYPVSALHNIGVTDLLDEISKKLEQRDSFEEEEEEPAIKIAIVGRPNVGKSSFLNCILRKERVIVHKNPGTTRDAISTCFSHKGYEFTLIDTAGLRHKRKIKDAPDIYSMLRTEEAVRECAVCLILIDGFEGITTDDLKILGLIIKEGKGSILCVNKWDLVKKIPQSRYKDSICKRSVFFKNMPIVFTSALTGKNVCGSLDFVEGIIKSSSLKISTSRLNRFLGGIKKNRAYLAASGRLRLRYIVQADIMPPDFLLFCNDPEFVSGSLRNFIENTLRREFSFFGTPIRIQFRKSCSTN